MREVGLWTLAVLGVGVVLWALGILKIKVSFKRADKDVRSD